MNVYPEITSSISESWQTGKWCEEVPLEELSPMWADWDKSPDRHFYVNEVARIRSGKPGKYFLPKRWVVVDGKECAEGYRVRFSKRVSYLEHKLDPPQTWFQKNKYRVREGEVIRIPAINLELTYPEIKEYGLGGFQGERACAPELQRVERSHRF